jgi:hypothetical protein
VRFTPNAAEHRGVLRELAEHAIGKPDLLPMCEHDDILDKIALHNDPTGWRLRTHIFLPGYFDRPHNHRWTHTLYGTGGQLCGSDDIDVAELQPCMGRTESAGDFYTPHHT